MLSGQRSFLEIFSRDSGASRTSYRVLKPKVLLDCWNGPTRQSSKTLLPGFERLRDLSRTLLRPRPDIEQRIDSFRQGHDLSPSNKKIAGLHVRRTDHRDSRQRSSDREACIDLRILARCSVILGSFGSSFSKFACLMRDIKPFTIGCDELQDFDFDQGFYS